MSMTKKCILLFHWLYSSLRPMRSHATADWLSMFAAERIWSSYFSETRPMAPALLALVFGFNIKPTHSAVDMGNQSTTACELFCIVCERLTIPIVQASQVAWAWYYDLSVTVSYNVSMNIITNSYCYLSMTVSYSVCVNIISNSYYLLSMTASYRVNMNVIRNSYYYTIDPVYHNAWGPRADVKIKLDCYLTRHVRCMHDGVNNIILRLNVYSIGDSRSTKFVQMIP